MNLDYLKPGATIPVTVEAIRYLVDVAKQLQEKQTKLQEWQYLTDAEIKEIIGSYGDGIGGYTRELFNKIEAKVREKNEREPKENK
jgi:hypothetical protein